MSSNEISVQENKRRYEPARSSSQPNCADKLFMDEPEKQKMLVSGDIKPRKNSMQDMQHPEGALVHYFSLNMPLKDRIRKGKTGMSMEQNRGKISDISSN